jgi:hypothetical protein
MQPTIGVLEMSIRKRGLALTATAILAVGVLAACGSSSKSGDHTTTTAAPNKGFDISTPEGSASLSLNGNLPPDWPSAFPVPSDATAAGSGSLANSSSGGMVAVYTVSGTPSDAFNFYKTNSSLDVTKSSSYGVGGSFVGTVQFTGTYSGSANIAGRNSTTYLVVVLKSADGSTTTTAASSGMNATSTLAPG